MLLLVDVSASGVFGSGEQSKLDLVVEVAAMLMFSALEEQRQGRAGHVLRRGARLLPAAQGQGERAAPDPPAGIGVEPVARPTESGRGAGVSQPRAEAPGGGVPDQRFPRPAGPARAWPWPINSTTWSRSR